MPFASSSVTLAGQPAKVGGTATRVVGWLVLALGWLVAVAVAGLVLLLGGSFGWVALLGGPVALLASVIGWALLQGGRSLQQSGERVERATKTQAIVALAKARGGVLRAWDVSQMLQLAPAASDALLTQLAKEQPELVTLDVDDEGTLLYRFPQIEWAGLPHVRVGPSPEPLTVDEQNQASRRSGR